MTTETRLRAACRRLGEVKGTFAESEQHVRRRIDGLLDDLLKEKANGTTKREER